MVEASKMDPAGGSVIRALAEDISAPDRDSWRDFLAEAGNGCLFHDLDFLAYHPIGRFAFGHVRAEQEGATVALLPGGVVTREGKPIFRSPLGASFGGPVLATGARAGEVVELLARLQGFARDHGWAGIEIVPPPKIYRDDESDAVDFALSSAGFTLGSRWLCHAIRLRTGPQQFAGLFRGKNVRRARAALKAGVETEIGGAALLDGFRVVFDDTYARHGVKPTHSAEELVDLFRRMPDRFEIALARWNGEPVAGLFLMKMSARIANAFYICSASGHAELNAGLALFAATLDRLAADGRSLLDLGPSSNEKTEISGGVAYFKESLGAFGYCRDLWTWTA
jgi:hypothetical protein